jgi:hypothetical protein
MISTGFKNFTTLFDVRIPEDDLKKIETFRSVTGIHVNVYNLMFVLLLVLSIKSFINARIWIPLRKCI